jgi:hypothetical protein
MEAEEAGHRVKIATPRSLYLSPIWEVTVRSIEAVRSRRLRGILLATQAVMMGQFASNLGGAKPAKTQMPNGPLPNGPLPNGPAPRHSVLK